MSHFGPNGVDRLLDDEEKKEDSLFSALTLTTPREVVVRAEEANRVAGHENLGYLSFSHGFAPRVAPMTRFPPQFDAWNDLSANVPALLSSGKLRSYCDDMPVLDATELPPEFALHGALVLGYAAHAYWNVGDVPKSRSLPDSLDVPWKAINKHHLGRGDEVFLGFHEMFSGNFRFEEGKVPPPPPGAEPCPWATEEMRRYGAVEYDPLGANISNFYPSFWLTGTKEEQTFYGMMAEVHTAGAPMVRLTVEAVEAVEANDSPKLKRIFEELLSVLTSITFDSFNKIQQQRKAPHHVEAVVWGKVVAAIPVPITSKALGPSGTAAPLIHLIDAFFGRLKRDKFVGKEVRALFATFPTHWRDFILAVQNAPSIRNFIVESDDRELQGLFGACLRQYAGESGFLGRHKLKTVGYLEVAMKCGRNFTIGGFAGLLSDRAWDNIADELAIGQDERFDIPIKASGLFNVGKIIQIPEGSLHDASSREYHIRIDITGSGIRYAPGSHIGILYETSAKEVHKTLLAFADGDEAEALRLGEEYMVELDSKWIKSLQKRKEFHNTTNSDDPTLPKALKLSTFLKWGELRPASRKMLHLAYEASHSKEIMTILNEGVESALTFSDVVTILKRETNPVDLLGTHESQKIDFSTIEARLRKYSGSGKKGQLLSDAESVRILGGTGLSAEQRNKIKIGSKSIYSLKDKLKRVVGEVPKLVQLIEPAGLRQYSVASSTLAHPNELHLYITHLKYETKSAVAKTSPLLANTHGLVHQRGAASDFIVSKCLPRYHLAIEAIAEQAGLGDDNYKSASSDLKFQLTNERKQLLKNLAHLTDAEVQSIVKHAKSYEGGETRFNNLTKSIENVLRGKPDPRDMSIVLVANPAPRFRLPKTPSPCIMIAGGSGLAPFRSFWQALAFAGSPAGGTKHLLLIQQRTRSNMAFEDEILAMVKAGLLDVEIMFSQDECVPVFGDSEITYEYSPGRKGYISKLIDAMQEHVAHMVGEENAFMYVCGTGGLAKTAVDSLDNCLCNSYGETHGKDELEKMVAQNRVVLDIFTSLNQPKLKSSMNLSELCQCNDFVGVRKGRNGNKEQRLLLVINATVYDMKTLFRLHPGGDSLLKLYCGMDATKAWEAAKHNKATEVVAMLEMFDTQENLHNPEGNLNDIEKGWYKHGWKAMAMTLVEIQNALSLAFEKSWDTGSLSSAENDLGEHFTVWEGKAVWRPKRSLLKGHFFAHTHDRLWSNFLPLLLGDHFDELRAGTTSPDGNDLLAQTDLLLNSFVNSPEHLVCDAVCPLIKKELDNLSTVKNNMVISPSLQAYMEEIREADDSLLENIKVHVIAGLQMFETQKSPLLPAFYTTFEGAILGIVEELDDYIQKINSLTLTAWGHDEVNKVSMSPDLKQGGIALLNEGSSNTLARQYVDKDEGQTRVLGETYFTLDDHDVDNQKPKCPFQH